MTDTFDVVIVGAGISGISAAYRIRKRNPGISYVILERRANIGGTWDLFRYPGIRSDSSIFTLSFPWEPWTRPEGIADGDHIREYMTDTARKHGIYEHIRFDSYVRSADWDSETDTWTVHADDGTTYQARFVFFATGYYNYTRATPPTSLASTTSKVTSSTRSTGPKIWTTPARRWSSSAAVRPRSPSSRRCPSGRAK